LILGGFVDSTVTENTPPASMFRVLRLVRLARLARLVRLDGAEDLVAMIGGMVGGMSTLIWALILFLMLVYITSLLFREFFGQSSREVQFESSEQISIRYYFSSVPRSMFTVFRYFFGDFSTLDGMSLAESIQIAYGSSAAVFLCVVSFMITIGVFNVIAAIFVESTLDAATHLANERKTSRMNDKELWSSRIRLLVRKLLEYNDQSVGEGSDEFHEALGQSAAVPVAEQQFQDFIKDKEVVKALEELEIDSADHRYLFDILDNDNTGSIVVSQLVDGLRRLRGDPRRSDIITIDLMVRAIQEQTNILVEGLQTTLDRLGAIVANTK